MSTTVVLPLWLVILTVVLAVWAVLDRLLLPSMRWALRRRAYKAIDDLNTKLKLHIQPFKLTRRQVLIDQLTYDPEVMQAVEAHARETGQAREVVTHTARRYAKEIVPSFSAYAYFKFGTRLARRISTLLYRVRLGYTDDEALQAVDPDSSVVFVINHRSNMDYVLVTYMAASSSALSYAVGEWAQIWGLRNLIRSLGAYFVRRQSRNALYRKILARYVQMATGAGVVQAMFPEGGLTRDGMLRPPKLGLLSYMVQGFDPRHSRDIVFIPVGVNYDRVLEDRILTASDLDDEARARAYRFSARALARYVWHAVMLAFRGRWYRYGYTCISFGKPISLKEHVERREIDFRDLEPDLREREIARLGTKLMRAVGEVVPALPVSLVATAILAAEGETLTGLELKARVHSLIERLERSGAYIHIPRGDRDYAIDVGLRMLTLRGLVNETDGHYDANPAEHVLLRYYANAIAHLLAEETLDFG